MASKRKDRVLVVPRAMFCVYGECVGFSEWWDFVYID